MKKNNKLNNTLEIPMAGRTKLKITYSIHSENMSFALESLFHFLFQHLKDKPFNYSHYVPSWKREDERKTLMKTQVIGITFLANLEKSVQACYYSSSLKKRLNPTKKMPKKFQCTQE